MSALSAIFDRSGAPVDEAATDQMLATMRRYGPGRMESLSDGPASLGCGQFVGTPEAHLARQPITSSSGRFTGVFDLRLLNRADLIGVLDRPELNNAADETLAIEAWDRWGEAALNRITGPFALIVWDRQTRTIAMARDPSGERPLCYHLCDRHLSVASYPRAIHVLGRLQRRVDTLKFIDALSEFNIDLERSYFEKVTNVVPGGLVRVDPQAVHKQRFYDLRSRITEIRYRRDDDYVEHAREILGRSVNANLRSDGDVGSFMSGGLDSSIVSAFAANTLAQQNRRLPVYTFVPEPEWDGILPAGKYGDETPFVQAIAEVYPTMDLQLVNSAGRSHYDWQEDMLDAIEQPTRAAFNVHWIHSISSQAGQSGVKTLLSGQMGNATLSYDGAGLYQELLRRGQFRSLARLMRQSRPSTISAVRGLIGALVKPALPAAYWTHKARQRTGHAEPWRYNVAATTNALQARGVRARAQARGFSFYVQPSNNVRDLIFTLLDEYIPGSTASYVGGMRSVHGVEIRDPFNDPRLVEWCASIPHAQFLLNGEKRSLAKRVASGYLPESICQQSHGSGLQLADAHQRLSRDRERMVADVEHFRQNDELAGLVDLDRLSLILEEWPSSDEASRSMRTLGLLSGTLPMALQCARFFQRESGRNA